MFVEGMRPEILVHPKSFALLTTGVMFVLSCRARGSPPPRVEWYKDDILLPNGAARISVLDSGEFLFVSGGICLLCINILHNPSVQFHFNLCRLLGDTHSAFLFWDHAASLFFFPVQKIYNTMNFYYIIFYYY